MGCKRLVFSSDYLPALTLPNVEVVNSPARYLGPGPWSPRTAPNSTSTSVVCATGYAAADYLGQLDVSGEQGMTLREAWRDGAHAYLGHGGAWISRTSSCCMDRTPMWVPTA